MSIDELDIQSVKVGQKVTVTADAFEGQTFSGTVTNVSLESTYSNGVSTYPVTVTMDEAGNLLPGMNVDGVITLEEANDVLTIPVDALMRGNQVYIKDDSVKEQNGPVPAGFKAVEVETGLLMILMWRSRADFLKAIQSMWQNPVRILAASLWAVREWAVPAVEWAARQVVEAMAVETVEVMAAVSKIELSTREQGSVKNAAIVKGVFMFRLRKGQQDDKNRKNDTDEKNTHEIKAQNKDNDTNDADLDQPGKHLIDLRHIFKIYHLGGEEVRANDDVSVAIDKGEFVAIVGKSGSGKSTLMNIIGALDVPTKGEYYLGGEDVSKMEDKQLARIRNKMIGFIFQQYNLLPKLNLLEMWSFLFFMQEWEARSESSVLWLLWKR